MASRRNWCPAIAASPDTLREVNKAGNNNSSEPTTFTTAATHHTTNSPQRPTSPRNKGAAAAQLSVRSSSVGAKVKQHVDASKTFSTHIALSSKQGTTSTAHPCMPNPFDLTTGRFGAWQQRPSKGTVDFKNLDNLRMDKQKTAEKVTEASFAGADIKTADVPAVVAAVPNAKALSFNGCFRGSESVIALAKSISKHSAETCTGDDHVVSLDLGNTEVSLGGGVAGAEEPNSVAAEELGKYIAASEKLQFASLATTGFSNVAATMTPLMLQNGSIEHIDLSGNRFGKNDDGIAALAQLLQENKYYLSVDLADNELIPPQSKQIIDAIATSQTRAQTPEPQAEPEPEEYTDELPPEEEPPTQAIGFPKEEGEEGGTEDAQEGDEDQQREQEEAKEAAPKAASKAKKPKADDEDEEGEEDEDEEEEEEEEDPKQQAKRKQAEEEAAAAAAEEEEMDEEERERLEEERAEEAKRHYDEAKAAWEEKQEQYIWGPQRQHHNYDESVQRRDLMQLHIDETTAMKGEEKAHRGRAKEQQLQREKTLRERRSGWTRLECITLAHNALGTEGARAVAALLCGNVVMSEEEESTEIEKERAVVEAEKAKIREEKRQKRLAEKRVQREADRKAKEEEKEARKAAAKESNEGAAEGEEGEDEERPEEGETAEAEDDDVVEDEEEEGDGNAAKEMDEKAGEEGDEEEEDGEAKPKERRKKPGVTTLRYLDLTSCSIGVVGLKHISNTLKDNCPHLQTLILRRNKFGSKSVLPPPPEGDDAEEESGGNGLGDDDMTLPAKVPVVDWISDGVQALSNALSMNTTLTAVDLAFNNMYPKTLHVLAAGFRGNRTLRAVVLDGNNIGHHVNAECLADLLAGLLEANQSLETLSLAATGLDEAVLSAECLAKFANAPALAHLNLSHNRIAGAMDAFADATSGGGGNAAPITANLKSLHLQDVGLTNAHTLGLGKVLKSCGRIANLSLRDNQIGDYGLPHVTEALTNHSHLRRLDLTRSYLTNVDALTSVLPSISFLQELCLGDNELETISARDCVAAIGAAPALRSAVMWGRKCAMEQLVAHAFIEAAATNPALVAVDLGVPLCSATPQPPPAAGYRGDGEIDDDAFDVLELLERRLLTNRLDM